MAFIQTILPILCQALAHAWLEQQQVVEVDFDRGTTEVQALQSELACS